MKWLDCKCLIDHDSYFQVGIDDCLLASKTIVMLCLRYVYLLFFCNKNDRPKKRGENSPAILRCCGAHCVFVPSLINCLKIEKEGKEACRPLNVPHFSTAAKISDFLDVCLCESLHIINVFWKLSLKLFKLGGRSCVISLKLPMYSHQDNVCQLLPGNYVSLYYRNWQISTVYFNCVLLNFNFKRIQYYSANVSIHRSFL